MEVTINILQFNISTQFTYIICSRCNVLFIRSTFVLLSMCYFRFACHRDTVNVEWQIKWIGATYSLLFILNWTLLVRDWIDLWILKKCQLFQFYSINFTFLLLIFCKLELMNVERHMKLVHSANCTQICIGTHCYRYMKCRHNVWHFIAPLFTNRIWQPANEFFVLKT